MRLGALVIGASIAACGGARPIVTSVEVPNQTNPRVRHPDGVLIEPAAAIPLATDRARARGVVALREPLAAEAVKDVVRAYVRGFVTEDAQGLAALLTPDAGALDANRGSRGGLAALWETRIRNFDYKKLAGSEVAHLDRIERLEYEELGGTGMPVRPPEMHLGDILVRVPIATPRVGAEQLFPEVLILLLRRDDGRFKIAGVGEENGS